MDIDFIKWKVSYARGFEWRMFAGKETIFSPDLQVMHFEDFFDIGRGSTVYYPLLSQRAIEGINKEGFYFITSGVDFISMKRKEYKGQSEHTETFFNRTIDEAKEQALKYIYEQEKK